MFTLSIQAILLDEETTEYKCVPQRSCPLQAPLEADAAQYLSEQRSSTDHRFVPEVVQSLAERILETTRNGST